MALLRTVYPERYAAKDRGSVTPQTRSSPTMQQTVGERCGLRCWVLTMPPDSTLQLWKKSDDRASATSDILD
jgi:hypothetical protein